MAGFQLTTLIANGKCRITVTTDGPPDQEKWYAIWKLSTAIVKLCVSATGRAGVAYELGKRSESDLVHF